MQILSKKHREKVIEIEPEVEESIHYDTYTTANEQVLEDGMFVDKLIIVPFDKESDPRKLVTANDFSLNSVLACGAVDQLKPVGTLKGDVFDSITAVEYGMAQAYAADCSVEEDKNIEDKDNE